MALRPRELQAATERITARIERRNSTCEKRPPGRLMQTVGDASPETERADVRPADGERQRRVSQVASVGPRRQTSPALGGRGQPKESQIVAEVVAACRATTKKPPLGCPRNPTRSARDNPHNDKRKDEWQVRCADWRYIRRSPYRPCRGLNASARNGARDCASAFRLAIHKLALQIHTEQPVRPPLADTTSCIRIALAHIGSPP